MLDVRAIILIIFLYIIPSGECHENRLFFSSLLASTVNHLCMNPLITYQLCFIPFVTMFLLQ